ncbi:MAG: hypothetical protein H6656_19350, partial [Ardenticatenaceae bacterium]|nr:hypothetical protein [Ardenticatenaceae bacterium]
MPRRLTQHHYEQLARDRQLDWLGEEVPKNIGQKTTWRCAEGHVWEANYRNIKFVETGCPYCSSTARKEAKDYIALAKQRYIEWLGPLPKNVNTKTKWRCPKNHTWFATYNGIRLRGKCPYCAGHDNRRKTEASYHALAKERGFVWLGPPVKNTKTKTQWQCGAGHTWFTTYSLIKRGT